MKVRGLPYQRSVLSTLSDASQYNQRTRMMPYVRHREYPYVTAALVYHIETQTQRIPVPFSQGFSGLLKSLFPLPLPAPKKSKRACFQSCELLQSPEDDHDLHWILR